MTKMPKVLLMSAIVLATSATSLAKTPVINHREHNQQTRIRQGFRSGDLSGREAFRLEREQAAIRVEEARAKADGKVTRRERVEIHHDLNQANRHIRRQRHD